MLTVEDEEDDDEYESKEAGGEQDEMKNITSCIRTLRFLQLLCEGHHSGL